MTRIAFVGLGIMGLPMAKNLVRAGHEVVGYNRSEAKRGKLADAGGTAAGSVPEAVRGAEVVITMLPDSPDVEAVVLGREGVLDSAGRGTLLVDMSTIAPATARTVAQRASEAGLRALDAPVSGGEQGAVDGTLSIMVGGERAHFDAALPLLEVLGATVVHVGPAGAGQTVKAANQLIVAGTIQLVAEALTYLDAQAVELEPAVRVLSGGLAGSAVLERKATGMLAREFTPGFRVDLHHKDLGIVVDSAREAGVVVPLGAVVAQLMAAARAQGLGELDHSALLLGVERLCGRSSD
ncbi:2-hydroxy-3-oxopropionate reductase [Actinophytocola xanthii]|uniref:2-hydroxy-3-oxopropionate reductase n=1 Tax=Actinophytocola xanthii TaxID=1912961 RepID=A0A1Q8CYH9_9PSEU|nr:2-hydroxy-3-oxopropionate reductase [Actinophytocola xanthii]OLF19408.1 2-hydroxy-3-oxopropionate reductase [Actinophytocola xanthii]